jgi:predicted AlkP superfamily pyrophosphatase or phosphodiesterase
MMPRPALHAPLYSLLLATAAAAPLVAQRPDTRPAPGQRAVPAAAPAAAPTLVVFLTVDQLTPDYFARFAAQLTGGLGRLRRGGAFFSNGQQDHATTETAPGHASVMSGRFPSHTGIVRNNAGVQDPQAPLIGASGAAASPFRFRGTVLFDWMRTKDPRSRALSVSRKDRGAILPLGRAHQDVYWYAPANGTFTTSTYYRDTLPRWVRDFNARRLPQRAAGRVWSPLLAAGAYAERDSVAVESGGEEFTFPHALPGDTAEAVREIVDQPWMDEITFALAIDGLQRLGLGAGPQTDLLAVSLSSTDAVGHRYGPDSKEMHDQILRLDRSLGVFLDSLYRLRDSTRVLVALTADHGMSPYPELHFAGRQVAGNGRADVAPVVRRYEESLAARGVDSTAFSWDYGMLVVDRPAFQRAGVNADSVLRAFAADVRRVPGVERVDLARDLAADTARAGERGAVARRWVHAIPPDLPVELVVTLQPYYYYASVTYATHGSPHAQDARVPIILYGAPFKPGTYPRFTRVVDIAPTLASALGVRPTERLDGRVLSEALKK